ncbi:hypothetical protein AB9N12_10790 [Bacteroides sp. AN502(2024)]|uniref:hypothetical protein n=1 Tax=Bacteroides sp. AN502(2024) TaxID=3160599 RepID=UPI0035164805
MNERTTSPDNGHNDSNRSRRFKPETEAKYHEAIELYRSTRLSCAEICRTCGITVSGFQGYLSRHHRELILARYDITCSREEAYHIKMSQLRGQLPATRVKYKDAIEACGSLDYIECNVSQIAREFGLDGTNLGRQLRTHYPEMIKWREEVRERLGISDHLQRGMRRHCKEQYTEAIKLLNSNSYITTQEAADKCGVSYSGLEQHLLFYHKDLVKRRIEIRQKAVHRQRKGEITGRGTVHAPSPGTVEKYAEAVHLYRTTLLPAAQIAQKTGVPRKGFYEHLHRWYPELICERNGIPCEEGLPVDWSGIRKYNPATKAKYAEAIGRLKESGLPTAKVAAEFGLHPECFRQYLKEHEPELYAELGMVQSESGRMVLRRSMEKYAEVVHLYGTTTESLKSLARRFGLNDCSLGQFIKRHFPELTGQHQKLVQRMNDEAGR